MRVQVNQAARDGLLDLVLDLNIGIRRQDVIGGTCIVIGQYKAGRPRARVACHRVGQCPHAMTPGNDLADIGLDTTKPACASGLGRLDQEAGDKIQLDREPGAAVQLEARHEPATREERVGFFEVAVNKDVLPGHENFIHDEDRVILVEAARQRVVERAAEHSGALLVRHAADELDAWGVCRDQKDQREILVLDGQQPDMRDKVKCVSAEPVATTLAPVT